MTASDTTRRPYTVDLLGTAYEIDLDDELQKALASAAHDVDSARRRLEAALTRIKIDAQYALDELRDGYRVNPHGPIQSEHLVASCAAEYDAKAAHARDLLRLAGLRPIETDDTDRHPSHDSAHASTCRHSASA